MDNNHPLAHWTCPNKHHLLYDYMPRSGPYCNVQGCGQIRYPTFTMVDVVTHALDELYQLLDWDENFDEKANVEKAILEVLRNGSHD